MQSVLSGTLCHGKRKELTSTDPGTKRQGPDSSLDTDQLGKVSKQCAHCQTARVTTTGDPAFPGPQVSHL